MTITAEVVADSISSEGVRITTFKLRYPRFIHSELMTHRVFSRNASSSRAIPVERMIEDLMRDPAMPVHWGANQKGMQARSELTQDEIIHAKSLWLRGMAQSIEIVNNLLKTGLHKQVANRLLEPWAHINVVVTATSYANFFHLRRHEDAQPEIKELADKMFLSLSNSVPEPLTEGQWHTPFISAEDRALAFLDNDWEKIIRVSVARCARVSYLTHDGRETSLEEDLALYDRLLGSSPLHASPAEHQATPDESVKFLQDATWCNTKFHGNFTGWIQYRKTLADEFIPG